MRYKQISKILERFYFNNKKKEKNNRYPLLDDAFTFEDLHKGIEVILSGRLTMGEITSARNKEG